MQLPASTACQITSIRVPAANINNKRRSPIYENRNIYIVDETKLISSYCTKELANLLWIWQPLIFNLFRYDFFYLTILAVTIECVLFLTIYAVSAIRAAELIWYINCMHHASVLIAWACQQFIDLVDDKEAEFKYLLYIVY